MYLVENIAHTHTPVNCTLILEPQMNHKQLKITRWIHLFLSGSLEEGFPLIVTSELNLNRILIIREKGIPD